MPPFEIVHHNRPYQSKGPTLATASEFATEPKSVLVFMMISELLNWAEVRSGA